MRFVQLKITWKLNTIFCGLIVVFLLSACNINRNVYVNRSAELEGESLEINFVGANEKNIHALHNCTPDNYWRLDSTLRKHHVYEMMFSPNIGHKKELTCDNRIWDEWYSDDCDYLYIIGDFTSSQFAKGITWKKRIKLESYSFYNFWSDRDIHVTLDEGGIKVQTGALPDTSKGSNTSSDTGIKMPNMSSIPKLPSGGMSSMPKLPSGK